MSVKVGLHYIEIWKESMEETIREYEKEDVEKGQIVFYGPSYFTRWSKRFGMIPLREAIVGKSGKPCIVNRGFGSSCSEHQLYYYPRTVRVLEPKVLVYSSLANGESFGYTTEEIWELAQRVIVYTMTDFPDTEIYLCGATPSRDMTEKNIERNNMYDGWLKEFAEKYPKCHFVSLSEREELHRKDIFVEDGVHYNQEGYNVFGEFFKEVLASELEKF